MSKVTKLYDFVTEEEVAEIAKTFPPNLHATFEEFQDDCKVLIAGPYGEGGGEDLLVQLTWRWRLRALAAEKHPFRNLWRWLWGRTR